MSIIRILSITIFSAVLANCGSQLVETPAATPWPSATVQVITQTTPTNTVAVAVATPIAATNTPEVPANTADSLASGLTPEGYHVLGDMAAPITFVDYSDYF
jgi:protein-disulfide isomerase